MPDTQNKSGFWQDEFVNPTERLSAIYDLGKYTDLTIIFPGYEKSLKVHRLILAMSSPVFEVMLYGPMAVKGDLVLPEDPPEAFDYLIEYIYAYKPPIKDVDTAIKLYHLAHKYQMCHLLNECSDELQSLITVDNLAVVYELSFMFIEDLSLKEKCREFVGNFSGEVLTSPCLGQLSLQCMKDLLQQDMSVDEVYVYKGLLQWGVSQVRYPTRTTRSQKDLRQKIVALLPYIRFLTLPLEDFEQHVLPSRILTTEEGNAIMENIKFSGDISIPAVCSPEREKRIFFSRDQYHEISLTIGDRVYDKPCKLNKNELGSDDIKNELWIDEDDGYDYEQDYIRAVPNPTKKEDYYAYGKDVGFDCKDIWDLEWSTEIASNVKVTKEIHVGCIKARIYDRELCKIDHVKMRIMIQDSESGMVRTLKIIFDPMDKSLTFAAAGVNPLILSPSHVYSITMEWSSYANYTVNVLSELGRKKQKKVSVSYGDLRLKGYMIDDLEILVNFWCFRELF